MINLLHAFFLGIIQGITEFLPISSSGHLIIFQNLLGIKIDDTQIFFDLILHLGTLLAIILFFNKEIIEFVKSKKNIGLIVISFTATSILGLILANYKNLFITINSVAIMLFINAIILSISNKKKSKNHEDSLTDNLITVKTALIIGIMQGFAVIPGISRSGSTIGAALFLGLSNNTAFKYSFILAIPTLIAATLYEFVSNINTINIPGIAELSVGCFTSFFIGFLSLILLKRLVLKSRLFYFAIYCGILSVSILFSQLFF